jgi:hypothetical protein
MSLSITYDLYRYNAGNAKYEAVSTQADLNLQTDLRAKDTSKQVPEEPTVSEQDQAINTHVSGLYTTPVDGKELEYPFYSESKWSGGDWVDLSEGGSVVYRVYQTGTDPEGSNLFLEVATVGG